MASFARYEPPAACFHRRRAPVENPVEEACRCLTQAWKLPEAQQQLLDHVLSLPGMGQRLTALRVGENASGETPLKLCSPPGYRIWRRNAFPRWWSWTRPRQTWSSSARRSWNSCARKRRRIWKRWSARKALAAHPRKRCAQQLTALYRATGCPAGPGGSFTAGRAS